MRGRRVESVISPRSEKFLDRKMGTEAVVLVVRGGDHVEPTGR